VMVVVLAAIEVPLLELSQR